MNGSGSARVEQLLAGAEVASTPLASGQSGPGCARRSCVPAAWPALPPSPAVAAAPSAAVHLDGWTRFGPWRSEYSAETPIRASFLCAGGKRSPLVTPRQSPGQPVTSPSVTQVRVPRSSLMQTLGHLGSASRTARPRDAITSPVMSSPTPAPASLPQSGVSRKCDTHPGVTASCGETGAKHRMPVTEGERVGR